MANRLLQKLLPRRRQNKPRMYMTRTEARVIYNICQQLFSAGYQARTGKITKKNAEKISKHYHEIKHLLDIKVTKE